MQPRLVWPIGSSIATAPAQDSKPRFRQHFQRSLRACLRRRFSLEEAFGLIFTETLQEVPLTPTEEAELFEELLKWARQSQQLFPSYTTRLFTGFRASNK